MKKDQAIIARRIGRQIKELRKKRGVSRRDLASKSGITPSYVTRLEQGASVPTVVVLSRIAETLDEDLSYFAEESRLDKELSYYLNRTTLGRPSIDSVLELDPEVKKELLAVIRNLVNGESNKPLGGYSQE